MGNTLAWLLGAGRPVETAAESTAALTGAAADAPSSRAQPQQPPTTRTVRNDLNLRKATLAATADPENPDDYLISFVFDADIPCHITVFFAAREELELDPITGAPCRWCVCPSACSRRVRVLLTTPLPPPQHV